MAELRNGFTVLRNLSDMGNREHTLANHHTYNKILTKTYFKLIQATHHIEIAENSLLTGNFPIGMSKQVHKLTRFIKPASPDTATLDKLKENTFYWMNSNMEILSEHYIQVTYNLMEDIQHFSEPEWTVALKWARNRFKHKLRDTTLMDCKDRILSKQSTLSESSGPLSETTVLKQTGSPQIQRHNRTHNGNKKATRSLPNLNSVESSHPLFFNTEPIAINGQKVTVQAQIHHREVSPISIIQPTNNIIAKTVLSMSHSETDVVPGGSEGDPVSAEIENKGIRMTEGVKETESHVKAGSESSSFKTDPRLGPVVSSSDSSEDDLTDQVIALNKPYRHINTDRKGVDWSINIHKPIVFIGDSNLSRVSEIRDRNMQVDSFPGANFLHIQKVLQKQRPHTHTQKIILAVGLNNRAQHPQKTAIKQLQGMWRAAREVFPKATVYTPIIQFSDFLPFQEQQNLKAINKYIISQGNPLWELNKLLFKVEKDCIHWTHNTAQGIFDFWCDQLNL